MSVPYSFSAVTKAKSSQVNDNFDHITALIDDTAGSSVISVDTTNDRVGINTIAPSSELHVANPTAGVGGRFDSTITGTTYGLYMGADANEPYIGTRTNHGLRVVTNGVLTSYFETTKKLRLYSQGSVTDYAHIYSSTANDVVLSPYADGDVIGLGRMPRRNHSSNTYVLSHIQRGWGYIVGNGTTYTTASVTLPVAFSSQSFQPVANMIGYKASSVPTSESDFTSVGSVVWVANAAPVSSASIQIHIFTVDGSTLSASNYYLFNWIAAGPL